MHQTCVYIVRQFIMFFSLCICFEHYATIDIADCYNAIIIELTVSRNRRRNNCFSCNICFLRGYFFPLFLTQTLFGFSYSFIFDLSNIKWTHITFPLHIDTVHFRATPWILCSHLQIKKKQKQNSITIHIIKLACNIQQ